MFCFLKVRWENLTTFCETRPSRHRVSILSEKGCTAHDARRETPVTHGPAWEQYAFIQNKINRLVAKSQNRVRSPCKRWDTPDILGCKIEFERAEDRFAYVSFHGSEL